MGSVWQVRLDPPDGGLARTSKVLLYPVRTVTKSRLVECLGHLAPQTMLEVDAALRVALSTLSASETPP